MYVNACLYMRLYVYVFTSHIYNYIYMHIKAYPYIRLHVYVAGLQSCDCVQPSILLLCVRDVSAGVALC